MTDDNRTTVERTWQALSRGDFDTAMTAFAPDGVVEWPQSGERIVGKEACLAVYRSYPGGSPRYTLRRVTGDGDVYVVEATGDYGEAEPYLMTSIVEFRDRLIVKQTDYWSRPFDPPGWREGMTERMERV